MSKEKLEVGQVHTIENGDGREEIKITDLERYWLRYVSRTPKGRWGRKETEMSRQTFWRQVV